MSPGTIKPKDHDGQLMSDDKLTIHLLSLMSVKYIHFNFKLQMK